MVLCDHKVLCDHNPTPDWFASRVPEGPDDLTSEIQQSLVHNPPVISVFNTWLWNHVVQVPRQHTREKREFRPLALLFQSLWVPRDTLASILQLTQF